MQEGLRFQTHSFPGEVVLPLMPMGGKKIMYLRSEAAGQLSWQPARSIAAQVAAAGHDCCARFQLKADL